MPANITDMDIPAEHNQRYFPIAVVGIGCKFPNDVNSPEDMHHVLAEGIDCVGEIPDDRWNKDRWWHPDPAEPCGHATPRAGMIKNYMDFDCGFFNMSPREAANLDYQHRMFLECVQDALDDAGSPVDGIPKNTGVYSGIGLMDHSVMMCNDPKSMNPYSCTGLSHCVAPNRVSFFYDINGPSFTVDTACAASLTAVHLACMGLWNGECEMAITGAMNQIASPDVFVTFNQLGVLSPIGMSCPFSEDAHGYVRSEGSAAIILKPLDAAIANNDHIYSVIMGCAIAHNGNSLSLTMPATEAQCECVKMTYDRFNLNMDTIDFVEAHGTGTHVGDPIEAEGIARAYTIGNKNRKEPLMVGSSKGNFGHLEFVAGMVQLLKASLMLERRLIYPNIHFGKPNPAIDLENWRLDIPTELREFKKDKKFRIGINTFGFGGSLVHVIAEESSHKSKSQNKGAAGWKFGANETKGKKIPIPLSSKSTAALKATAEAYMAFEEETMDAQEVACWMASRRSHYANRLIINADSGADFRQKLQMYIDKVPHDDVIEGTLPSHETPSQKVCFVFPGQGQQTWDMGRSMYKDEPVFRATVDKCDAIYKARMGFSFIERYNIFKQLNKNEIYDPESINEIKISQPAILFVQIGLFHLFESWGLHPDMMIGHSLGEVAAGYASNALTLEEAILLQIARAESQSLLSGSGTMAALRATKEEAEVICKQYDGLYVACLNARGNCTVAGTNEAIKKLCADRPKEAKQIRVVAAFHTEMVDPIKDHFLNSIKTVVKCPRKGTIDFYSTVTGAKYEKPVTGEYVWTNMREPVKFYDGIEAMMKDHEDILYVELAGTAVLLGCVRQIAKGMDSTPKGLIPTGQRGKDDRQSVLRTLANLHMAGVKLNWANIHNNSGKWLRLPAYQWQRQTLNYESEPTRNRRLDLEDNSFKQMHGVVMIDRHLYLRDNIIDGRITFPQSGFVEYMVQTHFTDSENPHLKNIQLDPTPCYLNEDMDDAEGRLVMSIEKTVVKDGNTRMSVNVTGKQVAQADLVKHGDNHTTEKLDLNVIQKRCKSEISADKFYEKLSSVGIDHVDTLRFKNIEKVFMGEGEALALLLPNREKRLRTQVIYVDAAFQLATGTFAETTARYVPQNIDVMKMHVPNLPWKTPLALYVKFESFDSAAIKCDLFIMDREGNVLTEILGLEARNANMVTEKLEMNKCLYTSEYQPKSACLPPTRIFTDHMSMDNVKKLYPEELKLVEKAEKEGVLLTQMCAAYARNAVENCPRENVHEKMVKFYNRLCVMAKECNAIQYSELPAITNRLRADHPTSLVAHVFERMGPILPLALQDPKVGMSEIFSPDIMERYFEQDVTLDMIYMALPDIMLKAVTEALKHKKHVRILEIGARWGSMTEKIVDKLSDFLQAGSVEYIATTNSMNFFAKIVDRLKGRPGVRTQELDIETDMEEQNFVPNSCDIVICLDMLHVAHNAVEATKNMRNLLCDDGWLALIETTENYNTPEIFFGGIDHCWAYNDHRQNRCWLSNAGWDDVLCKAGFSDVVQAPLPIEFYHAFIVGRKQASSAQFDWNSLKELSPTETECYVINNKPTPVSREITAALSKQTPATCQQFSEMTDKLASLEHDFNIVYFLNEDDCGLSVMQTCQGLGEKPGSNVFVLVDHRLQNADQAKTFIRTACNEIQDINIFLVNIDESTTSAQVVNFVRTPKITHRDVALNKAGTQVAIIHRASYTSKIPVMPKQSWRYQAEAQTINAFDTLDFHIMETENLTQTGVTVNVKSASLNYKDIVSAHDETRKTRTVLGSECCGIVTATGSNVSGLKVGDEVIAFGKGCLASDITVDSSVVFKKPSHLNSNTAAGVGMAFATAYSALIEKAQLQKGESILIHSACGGVGQAALKIAQAENVTVICTAATEEKRQWLRNQCGVEFVSDSRSTAFYDDVMKWTNGRGVDVVLNMFGEMIIEKSLLSLAHGGRLIHLGVADAFKPSLITLDAIERNCSVYFINMDKLMTSKPDSFRKTMQNALNLIEGKTVLPIPVNVRRITDIKEVLAYMQKGEHVGRVVIEIPDNFSPTEAEPCAALLKGNATYIVTGSNSGVGQELSRWAADNGATHLALISRSGHKTWAQKNALVQLRKQGVDVQELVVDLTDVQQVRQTMVNLMKSGAPAVKGIFNLAGLTEECGIADLTPAQLTTIINSRALSSSNMDKISTELALDLDHFVMLSTSKSLWGAPGLAGFNTSTTSFDQLSRCRRSKHLPAVSVQCGWIRGAGFLEDVSRSGNMDPESTKWSTFHVREFLSILQKLLSRSDLPPVIALSNEDWDTVAKYAFPNALPFRHLIVGGKRKSGVELSPDAMAEKVKEKIAVMLMMPADDIDPAQPMINYGVDSLTSIDIAAWMMKEFQVLVNQMDILEGLSTERLIEMALE